MEALGTVVQAGQGLNHIPEKDFGSQHRDRRLWDASGAATVRERQLSQPNKRAWF